MAILPNRTIQFLITGDPNATYVVEASADLITWTALSPTVTTSSAGTVTFADPTTPALPVRFYRVRTP